MMLPVLLLTLFVSGLVVLASGPSERLTKALSYASLLASLVIFLGFQSNQPVANNEWLLEWKMPWISSFEINFHLGLDGFSYWFVLLTLVMGLLAVFGSKPKSRPNLFYAAILWAIMGALGIFLAADVFLFFFFWEVALFPVYLMLIIFGAEDRIKASLRYIVYTQASGLILLFSIVGLVYLHYQATGLVSFDYQKLSAEPLPADVQTYLFFGFMFAFLIKLPAFPLHGWMPSFFSNAPMPIILVAILVKAGVFGLMRFSWPLLPDASAEYSLFMMLLGAITVIYGAIIAFGQRDPKGLLAYATFSHAGLLLVGAFCPNRAAFFGVLFLTICQALSTGGVLLLLERLYKKDIVPDLDHLGGFWKKSPQFSVFLLAFLLAGIGVPFFGNFVGEWMILWGTFTTNLWVAILATLGILFGAVYSLWLFQRLCFGGEGHLGHAFDGFRLLPSELTVFACVVICLLVLGFFPSLVSKPSSVFHFSSPPSTPSYSAHGLGNY